MLEEFINFICSFMSSLYGFYIIKKITISNEKNLRLKNILLILALSIIGILIHKGNYNGLYTIAIFFLNVIIYRKIFKLKIEESLIACGILMFLTFIDDLLISCLFLLFITIEQSRSIWYIYLISNSLVLLIGTLLINIKVIRQQLQNFYTNISKKKSISNIMFLTLLIIGLSALVYNISKTNFLNTDYIINTIIMIIFFSITSIFIKNKNNYNQLSLEYDNLFTYVQNFEDWIEKEQCNRHEYKNQLAVLRCLTKESNVKDKIDEILDDNINIEGAIVHQLKALPKGGLKGLMYYKAAIAQKRKMKLTVNVSIENESLLKKLSEKEIKILCKLIGIYFDNAIEAAEETRKKDILIEVYELKDKVNIVFSNTFKQHKNFNDRNKKGVSSKGEGHGNGLYFASKLISTNDWLEDRQDVIDGYYIEQLTIKKK